MFVGNEGPHANFSLISAGIVQAKVLIIARVTDQTLLVTIVVDHFFIFFRLVPHVVTKFLEKIQLQNAEFIFGLFFNATIVIFGVIYLLFGFLHFVLNHGLFPLDFLLVFDVIIIVVVVVKFSWRNFV